MHPVTDDGTGRRRDELTGKGQVPYEIPGEEVKDGDFRLRHLSTPGREPVLFRTSLLRRRLGPSESPRAGSPDVDSCVPVGPPLPVPPSGVGCDPLTDGLSTGTDGGPSNL